MKFPVPLHIYESHSQTYVSRLLKKIDFSSFVPTKDVYAKVSATPKMMCRFLSSDVLMYC